MTGNDLEHLIAEVLATGRQEAPWPWLRNMHFKEGLPHEGWRQMVDFFDRKGIAADRTTRPGKDGPMDFVMLCRK